MNKSLFDFNDSWMKLCDKIYPENILSEDEAVWYYAQSFSDQATNGGVISFFYNYGADDYSKVIKALDVLNAVEVKKLLEKVAALFPDKIESPDMDQRNAAIRSWPDGQNDALLEEVDENFYELQEDFESKTVNFIVEKNLA